MDFALRPVVRGLCKYESLLDGTLGLAHLAEMNDALDVEDENRRRIEAARNKR